MPDETTTPASAKDWERLASTYFKEIELQRGLQTCSYQEWNSASKLQRKHYLLLRSYWITYTASDFQLKELVSDELTKNAEEIVGMENTFAQYLETLDARLERGQRQKQRETLGRDGGIFTLVLYQQDEVRNLPEDSSPVDVPKVNMTPQPRYWTRALTRGAREVSPTPRPSNTESSAPNVITGMANLGLKEHGTTTPPKPDNPWYTDLGQSTETPTSDSESGESSESQLSRFSPFSPSQIKPAGDEQIVNMALISLLQALTIYNTRRVGWTIDRNVFRMGVTYEARTDGCLMLKGTKIPLAILETKAYVRKTNFDQIAMQETAQMAAWIKSHPEHGVIRCDSKTSTYRRLLISQDNREIYITVAEYDGAYQDYLTYTCLDSKHGEKSLFPAAKPPHRFDSSADGPFLRMRSYGPFDMERAKHMKSFATAVVAFIMMLESPFGSIAEGT